MPTPRFSAEASLYESIIHYRTAGGVADEPDIGVALSQLGAIAALRTPIAVEGENDPGTMSVPPLVASPVPSSRTRLPEIIGPFPHVLCQPCSVDQSGKCTQYCVHCPTPEPGPGCWASFTPCAPGECCPPGESPCYVSGQPKSCCGRLESCCNPETGFCCPPWQTCCNPETKFCCPQGHTCCCNPEKDSCCPPGQLCCDPQRNLCADIQTDPLNCGSCGNACGQGATCVNGQCLCPSAGTLKSSNNVLLYDGICTKSEGIFLGYRGHDCETLYRNKLGWRVYHPT